MGVSDMCTFLRVSSEVTDMCGFMFVCVRVYEGVCDMVMYVLVCH